MSRLKTTLLALVSLNAFGFWVVSCKDDNKGPACTPGTTRLCAGVSRCEGTQACLDDGSGYGDCDCSGALRMVPPAMDSTTVTTPYIGRSCKADADCGKGLTCFTAAGNDVFGGGAAGGYCTLNCNDTDSVCTAIDPQSACVGTGVGQAICLRTCLSQDPTSASENKCLGRVDVVCKSPAALMQTQYTGLRMTGWCFPQCNSDEDCPGRHCNLGTGVCSDTAPTG
ncbi:MAG TPA: hypothetical protein VG963_25285, partial [Polyangiaceae bacterium]|nr:hypothetical protein [Polyangiaceae bacterium]